MRQFLSVKKVEFPPLNNLLSTHKALFADTLIVLNGKGRAVDFSELVKCTAASLLKVVKEVTPDFSPSAGTGIDSLPLDLLFSLFYFFHA